MRMSKCLFSAKILDREHILLHFMGGKILQDLQQIKI